MLDVSPDFVVYAVADTLDITTHQAGYLTSLSLVSVSVKWENNVHFVDMVDEDEMR